MEKVSIIVPIYNSEKYLSECLNSIKNQTYQNIEIILIDDGSTDKSLQICNEFRNKDSRVKIIKEHHRGVSNARNRGIEESTGEYILFVDSDDWIEKDLIFNVMRINDKNNIDVAIYNSSKVYSDEKRNKTRRNNYKEGTYNIYNIIGDLIKSEKINALWNKLYKSSIINGKKIRFDANIEIGEDLLFNIKYFKNVQEIYISNQRLYNYRVRNESLTHKYKENKYNELMKVNKELVTFIENINKKNKTLKNIGQYIKFKNICSCLRDLKSKDCKYTKLQKKDYIKKIKKETPFLIVYSVDLRILCFSIVYSMLPANMLHYIF